MIRQEIQRSFWSRHGFENLLVWLFLYLVIAPFLDPVPYALTITKLFLTAALFFAAYTINRGSKILWISIVLLFLTLVPLWMNTLGVAEFQTKTITLLLILYLFTLVYSFSRFLFAVSHITWNIICAALCLYIIVGLLWGALYTLIELLVPGSFVGALMSNASNPEEKAHYLNYFSFITLTTLGYGDITPQTWGAAALCRAEAILGHFFTVVLVARLVGIHIVQDLNKEE